MENLPGFIDGGLLNGNDAKTPGQGFILGDVGFILAGRSGPDDLHLSSGQGGLEDRSRVRRHAHGRPRAD